jgi:enoyl-CoA hydratase/carnithine racemase
VPVRASISIGGIQRGNAMPEVLACDLSEGILVATLHRPEKLNAINYEMADALLALLDRAEDDNAIRALILTGAGEQAFSAGADIHEFSKSVAAGPETAIRDFVRRGQAMTARLEAFHKPVIAAVNGIAFGGGCEITEAAHLAVASRRASFAKPEINLGMPPTFGGTQRLPRLAGRKRALALLLTGDTFTPQHALEIGLVNEIVEPEELLPRAKALAKRILRHSPLAIGGIIAAVTRGINMPIAEGLLMESEQFSKLVPTQDLHEGLDAWMRRRVPVYAGR